MAKSTERTVRMPEDVMHDLQRHADRRGVTTNHLVRKIVETVLRDDIVDAVLDDAEGGD